MWMLRWAQAAWAEDVDLQIVVDEDKLRFTAQLVQGVDTTVLFGDHRGVVRLEGDDLVVALTDGRGRVVAAPTLDLSDPGGASFETESAASRVDVWARLVPRDHDASCVALWAPAPAALERAIAAAAGSGPIHVFGGPATVDTPGGRQGGDAVWVCTW